LWYAGLDAISNAIGYAKFYSRSHDAVGRVYDEAGNVTDTHEHAVIFESRELRNALVFNQKAVADYSDKRDESLVAVRIVKVKRLIDFRVWRDRGGIQGSFHRQATER
jgi:hypothetical protein